MPFYKAQTKIPKDKLKMEDSFSPNHSDRNDVTTFYQSYPPHSPVLLTDNYA